MPSREEARRANQRKHNIRSAEADLRSQAKNLDKALRGDSAGAIQLARGRLAAAQQRLSKAKEDQ